VSRASVIASTVLSTCFFSPAVNCAFLDRN
jgi:hypothetical protein